MLIQGWTIDNDSPSAVRSEGPGQARRLRPSQREAYHELAGHPRFILNGPTGWGKTTVLIARAARELADPSRKVLILVPQRIISRGFLQSMSVELPDGGVAEWPVGHDLCGTTPEKARSLADFLRSPAASTPGGRVAVATHAGFCRAFAALEETHEITAAFAETTLVIDEAHHVQSDGEGNNGLGRALEAVLDVPAARAWLATAFFFRGDRLPILPTARLEAFARFHLPFDAYLGELQHLQGYSYDFAVYKGSVFPEVEEILATGPEPTLIFCPPEGSPVLGGLGKRPFVDGLIDLILEHHPGSVRWEPGTVGDSLIVDLTDEADRDAKVELIMNEGHRIAAITTVGMMKEGADWVQASRCLDLVPSGTDQERNQKFGRLVRDHPDKRRISYFSFLPHVLSLDEGRQREACSRLFAHFHASLILRNAVEPVKVHAWGKPRPSSGGDGEEPVDWLGRFGVQAATVLLREATERAIRSAGGGGETDWRRARAALLGTFEDLGAGSVVGVENLEALARQVILIWRRARNPALDVGSLAAAGFDKVWASDGLESFRLFTAGVCGLSTFAELRAALDETGLEAAERWARDCANRYEPGRLPSTYAKDPTSRRDALKIFSLRRAKRGEGGCHFYPSIEEIFEAAGHHDTFAPRDRRSETEAWARECASSYAPGKLPTSATRGARAQYDAGKIQHLGRAKRGEGNCMFYPVVETIFQSAGHFGAFDRPDRRSRVESWARSCASRYQPGSLPTSSARDATSRKDASRIANLKRAKSGKGSGIYYPSVASIFEEAGHFGVFAAVDRLAEIEDWARKCASRYHPGSLPAANARDPVERADYMKIQRYRLARRGKGSCSFYPSLEAIFEEAGHSGVFDPSSRVRIHGAVQREAMGEQRGT